MKWLRTVCLTIAASAFCGLLLTGIITLMFDYFRPITIILLLIFGSILIAYLVGGIIWILWGMITAHWD